MNTAHQTLLTGIKPTGTPHIGNYLGAILPAIDLVNQYEKSFLFIADYHALNTVHNGDELRQLTRSIAATWLACGLDPSRTILYRQSAVPAVFELETILNTVTSKGWMNKAHAYKAAVDANAAEGRDRDEGVNMGLYNYPILMTADILLYSAHVVPVGSDQVQHIEIARDIAARFNHVYNTEALILPEASVQEESAVVTGLDGRKMSKSYGNIIPLFGSDDDWKKAVNSIPTDSTSLEEPKDLTNCLIFDIFASLASAEQTQNLRERLEAGGTGWGHVKQELFEVLRARFGDLRTRYNELMNNPDEIERILQEGEVKATAVATEKIRELRGIVGGAPLA